MTVSRCLGYLFPARFYPPALEQQYAVHRTEDVCVRCLLHGLSYTLVTTFLALSFSGLYANETLFTVTIRVQVASFGLAALLYLVMFAAHKQDSAASQLLRKYNDAAQTVPAVYICMAAPVVEPYRLMKLLGSTYAGEIGKLAEKAIERGEVLGIKEPSCGGWVQGDLPHGDQHVCIFTSYEAVVMAVIIHVVASAAIFGRTSPRWIFVAWHWNFAWYVFVRATLGDANSHTGTFKQDACILYITLMMLYLSGRRVDQLLRAEFLHSREVEQRVDAISRAHSRAAVHEAGGGGGGRLKRSLSWPGQRSASSTSGREQSAREQSAPEALPARRCAHLPKVAFTSSGASTHSASTQPVSLPAGPPSSHESSAGRSVAEQPPAGAPTPILTWPSQLGGPGSWLKSMIAGSRGAPAPHVAPAAEMSAVAAGMRMGPAPCLVAQLVVGIEESSAIDAFFGQDLVTEALAELATKEGQAVAVAADQVRVDPVRLDPVPVPVLGREREGDTPFDTPLDTLFQVRAAQHAAWVSSGDEAGGPTTRRGDESDESPSHGSSSSEISASQSSAASVHSNSGHSNASSERCHLDLTTEVLLQPQTIAAAPQRSLPLSLPMSLRDKFTTHVMCEYTPRPPADLPKSQWVSYKKLISLFQPFAPTEVWQHGPGNLKQLVTEWYKDDPAFAGMEVVAWCKLLKDKDAQPGSSSMVSKFCFEYTPSRKRSLG